MNRHPGLFSLALLCSLLLVQAPVATLRGQAAAPDIDAIKGSANVATAAPQIAAYINGLVTTLAGGEPTAAAAAREKLIEAVTAGRVSPTPAFLSAYAGALATGITPALTHQSDLVRLNAAIVVARVAERTDNPGLSGATVTLLGDKSNFVALWGFKAARAVLPAVLRNPAVKPDALFAAMVKAAATHATGPMGAPIAIEAYEALTLELFGSAPIKPDDRALKSVIPVMHQLLQQRATLYRSAIPPEPLAEGRATLFLVNSRVWGLHTPPQKLVGVQAMSDLVGLAAQHIDSAGTDDRVSLGEMIGLVSKALAVVPETQPIQAQLKPATTIDARTPADQVVAAVNAVAPALKTIKPFAALTPPPEVVVVAPAPAPGAGSATQPATSATTAPTATAPASTAGAAISP